MTNEEIEKSLLEVLRERIKGLEKEKEIEIEIEILVQAISG